EAAGRFDDGCATGLRALAQPGASPAATAQASSQQTASRWNLRWQPAIGIVEEPATGEPALQLFGKSSSRSAQTGRPAQGRRRRVGCFLPNKGKGCQNRKQPA